MHKRPFTTVGLLDKGADKISFVASNKNSRMTGKSLRRGKGICFEVLEEPSTTVLRPDDADKVKMLQVDSLVDVYYGKKLFRARITALRGHQIYDVFYLEDKQKEPGVGTCANRFCLSFLAISSVVFERIG